KSALSTSAGQPPFATWTFKATTSSRRHAESKPYREAAWRIVYRQRDGIVKRAQAFGVAGTGAANPKVAHNCRESECELRVQSGTRIIELLVSRDSEVRFGAGGKIRRTSESGH